MRTPDGVELRSTDPTDLVRELHKMSRAPCATDAEFRREMAARVALKTGRRIDARTDAGFIRSLVAAGALIADDEDQSQEE